MDPNVLMESRCWGVERLFQQNEPNGFKGKDV